MQIVRREPLVVIGIPVVAPFQDLSALVPAAWRELFDRCGELPSSGDGTFAEVSYYLGEGRYHEVVGMAVPAQTPMSGQWALAHVPAGNWAHCRHTGPVEEIGETFGAIEQWLREQGQTVGGMKLDLGYRADDRPQVHELHVHVPGPDLK